ncbi:MAG: hypothetical protein JXB45_08590 [Candidatus Krumholzibacteriota bacterium]|nr:hypothetical protein [Candidatus Krumholzibacteriota bacterium]
MNGQDFFAATRRVLVLFSVVVFTLAALAPAILKAGDKEIKLRYAPAEGEVRSYKRSSRTESNWMGNSITQIQSFEVEISLLEKLEDGNFRVDVQHNKYTEKMLMGDELREGPSRVKAEGKSVKVVLDPQGKIVEVKGYIMGIGKGEALEDFVDKWFFELPAEAVTKGSTWTRNMAQEMKEEGKENANDLQGDINFRLEKFENKKGVEVASIKFEGKLKLNSDSEMGTMQGDIELHGEVKIALEGGYVVEADYTMDMKGKMERADAATGKTTEVDVARSTYDEVKLQ